MVVSAEEAFRWSVPHVVLGHRGSAEFTPKNDERGVEQSSLLQILQQPSNRSIDLLALDGQGFVDRFTRRGTVVIPAPVVDLNEADAGFDQPPRE